MVALHLESWMPVLKHIWMIATSCDLWEVLVLVVGSDPTVVAQFGSVIGLVLDLCRKIDSTAMTLLVTQNVTVDSRQWLHAPVA
jgi:hypothetical protein